MKAHSMCRNCFRKLSILLSSLNKIKLLDVFINLETKFMAYEHEGAMPHLQELSINSYPEPNQQIPCIDIYFFKVHSNIVLPSTPRPL